MMHLIKTILKNTHMTISHWDPLRVIVFLSLALVVIFVVHDMLNIAVCQT